MTSKVTLPQGLHPNVPMHDYLADPCPEPSLSRGGVNTLNEQTPRHFKIQHPVLGKRPVTHTPQTDIGRAVHSLTQQTGDDPVHFLDYKDWRTKAAKEERDKVRSEGGVPLLEKQRIQVETMAQSMRESLVNLLGGDLGSHEQTVLWEEDGVWMRTRPDTVARFIVDIKTTDSVSTWVRKHMVQNGYDVQAAMQQRGVREVTGQNLDVVWLVQEREYPFLCKPIGASIEVLELGTRKIERAKMIFKRCLEKNIWPAYSQDIDWATPPDWAEYQQDEISSPKWKELF